MEVSFFLVVVLILVLAAEFTNGMNDAPNAIATVVSTRVLSPRAALLMATILNALGAMSGTAVAKTVGQGIVLPDAIDLVTVAASMITIAFWEALTTWYGLPTSTTHALVASLTGAGLATAGVEVLLWEGWKKVILGLFFSTFLGFALGFLLIYLVFIICRKMSPGRVRRSFGRLQILSAMFMAFGHGSNDGQKFIGVFTLALVLGGALETFEVTWPVVLACSATMGLGTAIGGWRVVTTMGMKMVKLEPHHGFAAETAAATCIEVASRLGIPLSTTHTISSSIMGVGASRRLSAVRWGVVGNVVTAWLVTLPVCFAVGWAMALVLGWAI